MAKTLRDSQVEDMLRFIREPRIIDGSDPGTGKTPKACVYTEAIVRQTNKTVLWVQPSAILRKNFDELQEWTSLGDDICLLMKPSDVSKVTEKHRVILCWSELLKKHFRHFASLRQIEAIVGDEWHMMYGNWESQRTTALIGAAKSVPRIVAMTGTLINGKYTTAFPIIHLINPRYYGHLNLFKGTHEIKDVWGQVVGWQDPDDKLKKILSRHQVKRSFEEEYGKENKVIQIVPLDLKPKQTKLYKDLEEKALIELEDRFLEVNNGGVAALRARQILACPEIFGCDEQTAKDDFIEIAFNDKGSLVIFASFIPEQERLLRLAEKNGRKAAVLNGTMTATEVSRVDKAYLSGELDTIIASERKCQVGFNWGHTSKIIFSSIDYQDGDILQAYRRGLRGVRDTPLLVYLLKYRCKVEHRLFSIVRRKNQEAHDIDNSREIFM